MLADVHGPPDLSHEELVEAQAATLAAPRRRYGVAARALFLLMDVVYGRGRTLSKFKVLELIARVPYQTWEQVAYIAVTHVHARTDLVQRIHHRVAESRSQQDNEQWHLLVIEDLIASSPGVREGVLRFGVLPQVVAFAYYQLSWLLYVIRPRYSYALNADFEDHAEHEYMQFVAEHPELQHQPCVLDPAAGRGPYASLADLFRQIGHDERVHKEESVARMDEARFR